MEGLNIPHQVIRKALHVSRSYAYRIKQGIFPTFYKQKLALSEIIGIPLKTLVLMEHGFEVDIPKNNLPELKEKLKGDLKTLAERHSLPGGVIASLLKKQVDSRRGY